MAITTTSYALPDLNIWTWGLIALAGYALSRCIYLIYFHPLASIPGPKLAAVSDLWKANAVAKHQFAPKLAELHKKYNSDYVRVGPNEVSATVPEAVKDIYGHGTHYTKGPFYDPWGPTGVTHFSNRDPADHANKRRSVANAYSATSLTTLEGFAMQNSNTVVTILEDWAKEGREIDVAKLTEWYSADTVSEMSFNQPMGLLAARDDPSGFMDISANATEFLEWAACFSNWGWLLPTRFGAIVMSLAFGDKSPAFFTRVADEAVRKRMELEKSGDKSFEDVKDLLYRFLHAKNIKTGQPLTPREVTAEVMNPILAGSDTTKASLNAALRYIYSDPASLARLREEISEALNNGTLSFPPTYGQASKLEFLSACIKEAMRLHPPVGMHMQRIVPKGGRQIGDKFFPEGTMVGISGWQLHYDKRAYGQDAAVFRPERWLEEDRATLEKYNLSFGQGSRICIGKNISLLEMSIVLPMIVDGFDIHISNPKQPYVTKYGWFAPQHSFMAKVTKREGASV